jgi:hypothetical protein
VGDAHRVWFPEMVEHLRLRWRDDLSMAALLGLRDDLDDMLGRVRSTRHIAKAITKGSQFNAQVKSDYRAALATAAEVV